MSENKKIINEQLDKAIWETKPVSSTDATGLIQGLPVDDEVKDTITKMYDIPSPVAGENNTTTEAYTGATPRKRNRDEGVVEP